MDGRNDDDPGGINVFPTTAWTCQGVEMPEKLNTASIQGWLKTRDGWRRKSNKLVKDFDFGSFRSSIVFVNRVASLADTAHHHPEIEIRLNEVRVTLHTHDAGGVTQKDITLAEQIDFATSAR